MTLDVMFQTSPVSAAPRRFTPKALPSVLGLLAGCALALPVAADTAGLQFYGRAHVSADWLDNGADSDLNVSSNSSRLGVRASTELADGLKGILQIESTISYDNGSGSLANRDTFVGIEGGFGSLRLGQMDTPLKQIRGSVDFFGDQIGDLRNLTRLAPNTGVTYDQDFDARFRNGIYYQSPRFGDGFVVHVHYTPQVATAPDLADDSAAYSTSLVYNAEGLYVSAAYEQWTTQSDSNALRLGARYSVGDWTFSGLFQLATIKTGVEDEEVTTVGAGASYKLSPTVLLKAQLYNQSADTDDMGTTLIAVGADYILSRQFRVLFAYAAADNEDLAAYRVTGGGGFGDSIPTVTGEMASGLSVGLRYDF